MSTYGSWPAGADMAPQSEKNFAYYVPLVKEATHHYDLAILHTLPPSSAASENEEDYLNLNLPALLHCRRLSESLLADAELPLEIRILLNYYMCAYREDDQLRVFYLRQALAAVERLEELERLMRGSGAAGGDSDDGEGDRVVVEDPMREILEVQLAEVTRNFLSPQKCTPAVYPQHQNPEQYQHQYQHHQYQHQHQHQHQQLLHPSSAGYKSTTGVSPGSRHHQGPFLTPTSPQAPRSAPHHITRAPTPTIIVTPSKEQNLEREQEQEKRQQYRQHRQQQQQQRESTIGPVRAAGTVARSNVRPALIRRVRQATAHRIRKRLEENAAAFL